MIDNQHKQIKGYRDLTEVEIGAMNDCKLVAVEVGTLCDKVAGMAGVDQRWVAIAKTDLQRGFMCLVRAIARPDGF
jgi:hypothetical protein